VGLGFDVVIIIRAESTSATKGLMMSFKNEETSQ
jgi:hypothetical protein